MPLILGAQSATAAAGYSIDNSCRFNVGDTPGLSRSITSTNTTWTFSCWIKLGTIGSNRYFFGFGSGRGLYIKTSTGQISFWNDPTETNSTNYYRDPSAWYHIVLKSVSGTGYTYVNGVIVAGGMASFTTPALSSSTMYVGRFSGGLPFDGYMAEVFFTDGTAYNPSAFGEYNEDSPTIWQPKDCAEDLTFGTDGFYLDFEDSADLGNDVSGEGNDFTPANLAAVDQATDTPTNNFSTMNPLDNFYGASTFSEGNCKMATATSPYTYNTGTMGMASGKWYAECKLAASGGYSDIGMAANSSRSANDPLGTASYAEGYAKLDANANLCYDGSCSTYGDALAVGDVVGIYIDLDNLKLYYGIDGVIQNSGTGYTIAVAAAATTSGFYRFAGGDEDGASGSTLEWNFGGCPSFALTSAVNDANGYGNFEYDPSDGGSSSFDGSAKNFLALCTKNLGSDGG